VRLSLKLGELQGFLQVGDYLQRSSPRHKLLASTFGVDVVPSRPVSPGITSGGKGKKVENVQRLDSE